MWYRALGGLAFILIGLDVWPIFTVPLWLIGAFCFAAGIALLAGK